MLGHPEPVCCGNRRDGLLETEVRLALLASDCGVWSRAHLLPSPQESEPRGGGPRGGVGWDGMAEWGVM